MTMPQLIYPNFLVIGAQRSGTTTLYHYLRQHPQVFLCSEIKELNFFIHMHRYNEPFQNYAQYFEDWNGEIAIGDVSPRYLFYFEYTADLIAQHLPNIKLVAILRHPVERAYSAYCYSLKTGREWLSFEQAMNRSPRGRIIWDYRRASTYAPALQEFLGHFDRAQMYFILFEDLINHTNETLVKLYEFIGIDNTIIVNKINRTDVRFSNTAQYPRIVFLYRLWAYISQVASHKKGFRRILHPLNGKQLNFPLLLKDSYKPIPENLYYRLLAEFESDITETSQLIGQSLTDWFSPRSHSR